MSARAADYALDGAAILALFAAAADSLAANAGAIDAINVYPVPDGDTGSNMAATLREAVESAQTAAPGATAGAILAALAKGALYGARGNSGVILSQALRGLATGAGEGETWDGTTFARCLERSAEMAYAAVSKPVEGTMLTVLRAAARGAGATAGAAGAAASPPASFEGALEAAIRAAEEAERLTPTQLPALAEAGVTDAGGEGICVILRGLMAGLTGEQPALAAAPARPFAEMAGHEREGFGFCTEFVIESGEEPLDLDRVRTLVERGDGRSVVVVGDAAAVRVHVHTDDPESLLSGVAALGRVLRTKVEDMSAQHVRFAATGSGAGVKTAALAMSPGPGFDAIFSGLGVETMRLDVVKPAAGAIAAAADALRVADVIVLPNHGNVLMAARQAAELSHCTITVVPSTSVAEGIAAAVAFSAAEAARANAANMERAMEPVHTVEVTTAAADRTADGVAVRMGDPIVIVDGRLVAAAATPEEALVVGLQAAAAASAGLVTVYAGEGIDPARLDLLRDRLASTFPGAAVECIEAGQPLYAFIAAVEP